MIEVFDIDKFVDEIKDKPCPLCEINDLKFLWEDDWYILLAGYCNTDLSSEEIEVKRTEYFSNIKITIDEVEKRLNELLS